MSSYDFILKKEKKALTFDIASIEGKRGKALGILSHELLANKQTKIVFDDDKATTLFIPPGKDVSVSVKKVDGGNKVTFNTGVSFVVKDGLLKFENFSNEDVKRFKSIAIPNLDDDLKRATEFDALKGEDSKRIMTPLTTKKAIEAMGYDEKISEKTSIEDLESAFSNGLIGLAHLLDPGKDLVEKESGKLFRNNAEVGVRVKNSGTVFKIPDRVKKARIFFKAQCESPTKDNWIFYWVGKDSEIDENQKFVSKLNNRTTHYSVEVDLSLSHDVVISTVQAWDKYVKIWDFDWKEVL